MRCLYFSRNYLPLCNSSSWYAHLSYKLKEVTGEDGGGGCCPGLLSVWFVLKIIIEEHLGATLHQGFDGYLKIYQLFSRKYRAPLALVVWRQVPGTGVGLNRAETPSHH